MSTLRLEIDPAVAAEYPEILVGGFVVDGLDRLSGVPEDVFSSARPDLEGDGLTLQNLPGDPRIQGWREAIGRCGLKASTFKSSPEQLGRRLLKGGEISTPIPVVNAYCAVSARHLAAMGGYDLSRLPVTDLRLRPARPEADSFSPIGGKSKDFPLSEKVVVYAAGDEVICFAFNHRDSRNTSITPETRRAVFFSEGASRAHHDSVRKSLAELADRLRGWGASPEPAAYATATDPELSL